jgi:O-succinylbenzoic acid--CoA ligase
MPRALLARARAAGFPVCPSYGLTQACSTVTVAAPGDLETAGRAIPGVGVAITADGEIVVSGGTVNTLGSLRTGDLGRLDDQGRLIVTGRKGDVIITGGENVSPAEIEAVIAEHPGVAESAVFARPHPLWGEAVTALVVPRDGATLQPAELRAHCLERLAGFKVPKAFEVVSELPRTESGKVRRADLR